MPKRGETASPETKRRMAEARRAWWQTADPDIIEGLLRKQRGQKRPKTSAALKGKPRAATRPRTGQEMVCARQGCGQTRYVNQYERIHAKPIYCSVSCARIVNTAKHRQQVPTKICDFCGKEFLGRSRNRTKDHYRHHYCSRPCAQKAHSGENSPHWTGGRTQRPDGYIDLCGPALVPEAYHSMLRKDGRVMEHRIVMAKSLGRPLEIWEVVHHKDGVRNHNALDNLELHSAHEHNGITAFENREIARLKREMKHLQHQLDQLQQKALP